MPTDVVMPQMGESIAEGTIVRWMKKVGDKVDRDEPLFEISTDKVDAEIPSPAAGVVSEIRAKEGETVPVNSIVAVIGQPSEAAAPPRSENTPAPKPQPEAAKPHSEKPVSTKPETPKARSEESVSVKPGAPQSQTHEAQEPAKSEPQKPSPNSAVSPTAGQASTPTPPEEVIRQRSSPLVRKIAQEHHVDISQIPGTGIAGRVTKHDILEFLGEEGREGQEAGERREGQAGREEQTGREEQAGRERQERTEGRDRVEKMSVMRRKIAEHMVLSRRTSAHVHSVFEVNFARVVQARERQKAEFESAGAKLTYLSFIVKAVVDAVRAVPIVNASVDGENIVYHKDVNVGIAVALDWGLIVPVIKRADERNLLGLSRAIADLAARARAKQLKPDDVTGGTFTITNPGVFGALFGMPIINQPQAAILGVGAVEKRPVVVDDAIAIRPMAYLSLGYDHRIIDGAVADQFMSHVKDALENWDPEQS